MRVGLVNDAGIFERIVELNGGACLVDTGCELEELLVNCGCETDTSKYNTDSIVDGTDNNIKKRTLDFAKAVVDGTKTDVYEEVLVIYSKECEKIFTKLDKQRKISDLFEVSNIAESDNKVGSTDKQDIKYFDSLITDAIPDKIFIFFKDKNTTYDKLNTLLRCGFVNTVDAVLIMCEYNKLDVVEEHSKYVESYIIEE